MSLESTKAVIARFLGSNHSDLSCLAEGVVFTNMASGDTYEGREAVGDMLRYIYHVAFDAHADVSNQVFSNGKAVIEGNFVGTHTAEFAGKAATNKHVRVPLCVVYDLENDEITRGRIYFELPALFHQLEQT